MLSRESLINTFVSPLFIGLFAAIAGVLLTILLEISSKESLPTSLMYTIIALLFVGLIGLISIILLQLQDIRKDVQKLFQKGGNDFRILEIDEANQKVCELMKDVKEVRIVGTARQDAIEKWKDPKALDYLKATEKRFRSKEPLIYQRITTNRLRPFFYDHLEKFISYNNNNSPHVVEISFIESDFPPISYQIFDEQKAMLIIDNVKVNNIKDYAIILLTTNAKVIEALKKHFDASLSNKCSTVEHFQKNAKRKNHQGAATIE